MPLGLRQTHVTLTTGSKDAGIAAIVARTPLVETAREIADEFRSQIAAFGRVSATSEAEIIEGVERNLLRWSKWAATGAAPPDSDFDPLREWARARANEGVRLEDLLRAFGLGSQIGWHLIRRNARSDEVDVLLDAADLIMQYVNRMSAVVTDTYLAERELLVSEDERRTRKLLDRLTNDLPVDATHHELAARLAMPVEAAYVPFAIVMPERTSRQHAALAARLRGRGSTLTATEGDRVVGLTSKPLDVIDFEEGSDVILAIAELTPREELAEARDELVLLAERGRRLGLRGRMRAEDHLLEILIGRSPRMAARLRAGSSRRWPTRSTASSCARFTRSLRVTSTARPPAPPFTCTATRWPIASGGSRRSPGSTSTTPATWPVVYLAEWRRRRHGSRVPASAHPWSSASRSSRKRRSASE